eukprot:4661987-Prymnesium_polylepis.1
MASEALQQQLHHASTMQALTDQAYQEAQIYQHQNAVLSQLMEAQQALQQQTAETKLWKSRAEEANRALGKVTPITKGAVNGIEMVLTLLAQAKVRRLRRHSICAHQKHTSLVSPARTP